MLIIDLFIVFLGLLISILRMVGGCIVASLPGS